MKLIKTSLFSLAAILLVGCNEDNPWRSESGVGKIAPHVSADMTVKDAVPLLRSTEEIDAPSPDSFKIALSKADGSYSASWNGLSEFPVDDEFPIGAYLIEASYGDADAEGFDAPYFYGSSEFVVREAETVEPQVTARLANSMVSIEYTEAFKNYFPDYATTLHSEGGAYIEVNKTETRPAFVKPGNISLTVSLTKQNGVSATFQPADFVALAQHHYHVTLDVNNGATGDMQLSITFDSSLVQEDVVIDLSDELMLSPAPQVTTVGFTPGTPINITEGTLSSNPMKFSIIAKGGISSAIFSVNSASLESKGFPAEVDLVNADVAQQEKLKSFGLDCKGLWKNPDKIAEVDVTSLVASLTGAGTHEFTLVVKDKLTKVNDPVTLTVSTVPVVLNVLSVGSAVIGINEAFMTLEYSGENIEKNVVIEAQDKKYGTWSACDILSVEQATRAVGTYNLKISIPEGTEDVPLRIKYMDMQKATATIARRAPEYSLVVDAFAKKAIVKIQPAEASLLKTIADNIVLYVNGTKKTLASKDVQNGMLYVEGLTPSTSYTFKSALSESAGADFSDEVTVTTESEAAVPNGGFETTVNTFSNKTINSGGVYYETKISVNPYQNKTTFNIFEPSGWASVNAKTFNLSANNQNTWYVIPSVEIDGNVKHSGNNAVKLTNVAFDTNGPSIDKYNFTWGKADPNWGASQNAPSVINYRAAGKVFLGSYAFNTSSVAETYSEGLAFGSRPSALTGWYQYSNSVDNADYGVVTVELLGSVNGTETVIASGSARLSGNSTFAQFSIPLTYKYFGVKAARLRVMAASSSHNGRNVASESAIKTVNDLRSATSKGNVLWIDDFSFVY